jgi:hypothetical protein
MHMMDDVDSEAPLLQELNGRKSGPCKKTKAPGSVGELGGVLNLVNAILGAGLLSIPRALSCLGCGLSLVGMFAVVRQAKPFTTSSG